MVFVHRKPRGRRLGFPVLSFFNKRCILFLIVVSLYFLFEIRQSFVVDIPQLPTDNNIPYFHPTQVLRTSSTSITTTAAETFNESAKRTVLVIAAAPRSVKHIVSLWGSLECFANQVDHVAIVGPMWSESILERFFDAATSRIPRFSNQQATLETMVTINDRYDVGLWCDALGNLNVYENSNNNNNKNNNKKKNENAYDQISLLNDSIFALRESNEILNALTEQNVSMTSLNYSKIHPKGRGEDYYWLESVWRGFDKEGIRKFIRHSCRPSSDPHFCKDAWWGQKGCIVEHFERQMAWKFDRNQVHGLYDSDVPKNLLTRRDHFPSWVRHAPYWQQLVREQDFPIAKVNWDSMISSIHDERLQLCTQHLDRDWLEGFDFSQAKSAI